MAPGQAVVKSDGGKKRLVIDYRGMAWGPDIAQYGQAFADVVEKLREADADEVVLSEYYERIYDEKQTNWLKEVADLVNNLEADAVWSPSHLGKSTESKTLGPRHDAVLRIMAQIKSDPFRAYLTLAQEMKTVAAQAAVAGPNAEDIQIYLGTLRYMRQKMEEMKLIQAMKDYLSQLGSIPEGRTAYHAFFESSIKPSFIGSRIFFSATEQLELVDQYDVGGSKVYIYRHPDQVQYLYFINPPEYSLPPEKYFLLEKTKEVVAQHRPESVQFLDITQARKYFRKVYVATIADLALKNNIKLTVEEKEDLASIVARYTIGYGIMEVLLSDRRVTDVYIDSPLGDKPIYLVHGKYGQCQTNVIFSNEEARSIVSRFRALSGRPFDEAHPILDFDLEDLQTRIAVIGKPLALDGIAFALRLHKQTPWTLAQFVDGKAFGSFAAGMLSFFVDAQASMLIVGSRGAGKTSLLQAMMLELPQNLRVLVQEDSVTADTRILVEQDGRKRYTTVGELIDGQMAHYGYETFNGKHVLRTNPDGIKVFALQKDGKIRLSPSSQFTRHRVDKDIYEVTTRTGKRIKVTQDHSLFTLGENGQITNIKPIHLKPGSHIVTPSILRETGGQLTEFNALPLLLADNRGYVCSETFKAWLRENRLSLKEIGSNAGFTKSGIQAWIRKGTLPISVFSKLCEKTAPPLQAQIRFKLDEKSKPIPAIIPASDDIMKFCGLWLADGCYDGRYGTIISVDTVEENALVDRVAQQFKLDVRRHSDGFSKIISNTGLVWFAQNVLGLNGDAYTKRLPDWAFESSQTQRAGLLNGLFSGDGYAAKNELYLCTASNEMAKEVETLLLSFGIISRTKFFERDKTYRVAISDVRFVKRFEQIGFLQYKKRQNLRRLCQKEKKHDTADIIPFSLEAKLELCKQLGLNRNDYVSRDNNIGKQKLQKSILENPNATAELLTAQYLLDADIYWDEVTRIRKLETTEQFVYDFSVPEAENFVCENILAHNTQELPVPQMKKLGLSIQRMKTRPPLGGGTESEVSAEDALRTALRLGDSVLIVGEVRSGEAKALYEAMRVGAVGNVVMGTIHGESAYSIWDRVVNDLGVPTTSFKATDFCVVAAPIRFKGSLKRHRRLIEVTEVLKDWDTDPGKEHGFVNWLTFDANKDDLEIFKDDIMNKSEWLKKVQRMRGLDADAVWSEILSRGQTKQYLVDKKNELGIPRLLEAEYAVRAHMHYLILSERQREETGLIDYPSLLGQWKEWVDNELVADLVRQKQGEVAAE